MATLEDACLGAPDGMPYDGPPLLMRDSGRFPAPSTWAKPGQVLRFEGGKVRVRVTRVGLCFVEYEPC